MLLKPTVFVPEEGLSLVYRYWTVLVNDMASFSVWTGLREEGLVEFANDVMARTHPYRQVHYNTMPPESSWENQQTKQSRNLAIMVATFESENK